jgi:cytochrome c553
VVLITVVIVSCFGFIACGKKTPTTTQAETITTTQKPLTTTAETSAPATTTPVQTVLGGLTWNDMPVYPGAVAVSEMTMNFPADEENDWTKSEHRVYETSDDVAAVSDFYEAQMPANGWEEMMTMNTGEASMYNYTKNNEQDGAYIWIVTDEDEGKTVIQMTRGTSSGAGVTTATDITTTTTTTTKTSKTVSGGLSWNDMPVYPGAAAVQEMSMNYPAGDEEDWTKTEYKMYETTDDVAAVSAFYKAQMPANGWEEIMTMNMGEASIYSYMKNNEQDGAYIWIIANGDEEKTVIQMTRASKS